MISPTRDLHGWNYLKPLGLGYLKSYLRMELPELDVDIYEDIDSVIQSRPACVGISAPTEDFAVAQGYVKRVQEELGSPVLLGGVHISLLPQTLPGGAIACIGEGEETLTELMNLFLRGRVFDPAELSNVKGIAYWDENGNLVQTEPRGLITPLDRLPLPDRDALGIEPGQNDALHMLTSRGCPYNCKFCVSRVHWKKYREFSADYVLHEIEELVSRYGVDTISIFDDLFIVNRKRLREIADKFAKRHYHVGTSFAVRANLVDDELCELLKKLNVRGAMFGAESFSEPVLRELKLGTVTVAQNQRALDTLHKHGIATIVSMIFDAPEETREDMSTSWRAIFDNLRVGKICQVSWGLLQPYPGSGYWDKAVEKGNLWN
ncbi:MAG: B12-binding domain-containing radical SAM protein [Dehalococcoidia bacterium]